MSKNMQLNAHFFVADEYGEQVGRANSWKIKKPKLIDIVTSFAKIHFKEFNKMTNSQRGRYILLFDYIEYGTNKLVFKIRKKYYSAYKGYL